MAPSAPAESRPADAPPHPAAACVQHVSALASRAVVDLCAALSGHVRSFQTPRNGITRSCGSSAFTVRSGDPFWGPVLGPPLVVSRPAARFPRSHRGVRGPRFLTLADAWCVFGFRRRGRGEAASHRVSRAQSEAGDCRRGLCLPVSVFVCTTGLLVGRNHGRLRGVHGGPAWGAVALPRNPV